MNTGTLFRFIETVLIPCVLRYLIRPSKAHISVPDTSNHIVDITGTITLAVNRASTNATEVLVERLHANVTLECKICGVLIKATRLRL